VSQVVLLARGSAAAHEAAVARALESYPDLRFHASWATSGSVDFVDVLELDPEEEDTEDVVEALEAAGDLEVEALEAEASPVLRAPGGGAPGGLPPG
jgi:uncharacterized protein with GYD domain